MRIGLTIDCPDPVAVAVFWERFLGYRRRPAADGSPYVTVERPDGIDGPPQIVFQQVPEPKEAKVRAHIDLFVDHAEPMMTDMISAGAKLVSRTEAGDWTTRVLQDPSGTEFCIIGPN
jgi:hypothetical protein